MGFDFRIAGEGDCETLVDLVRQYHEFDQLAFNGNKVRHVLRKFLQDPSLGRSWLICDGTAAVGYIVLTFGYSLEYKGRDAFIDEFFIQESHRGRGWDRKAGRLVEESARDFGVNAIHLEVTRPNAAAQRLYTRLGFQSHDHILMTKWIGDGSP